MDSERPDQYRGVPYLAQVIEPLLQLRRYTESEPVSYTHLDVYKRQVQEIGKQLGMKPEEVFRLSDFSRDDFLGMMTKGVKGYSHCLLYTSSTCPAFRSRNDRG